jgi:hypothetical protein
MHLMGDSLELQLKDTLGVYFQYLQCKHRMYIYDKRKWRSK